MAQYAKAGVLSSHMQLKLSAASKSRSEATRKQIHTQKKQLLKQGMTNNTAGLGMKHFKNESLNY